MSKLRHPKGSVTIPRYYESKVLPVGALSRALRTVNSQLSTQPDQITFELWQHLVDRSLKTQRDLKYADLATLCDLASIHTLYWRIFASDETLICVWITGTNVTVETESPETAQMVLNLIFDHLDISVVEPNKIPPSRVGEIGKMDAIVPHPTEGREVFVVHGRNERIRQAMFDFLRAIDLKPMEWEHCVRCAKEGAPYVGEVLERALSGVSAVVVLLTPDDLAKLNPQFLTERDEHYERECTGQARPNVLFEAGMAFAMHPEKTILVEFGHTRPFSDVVGRHILRWGRDGESRYRLMQRLRTAGCIIDPPGTDWMNVGDFSVDDPLLEDPSASVDLSQDSSPAGKVIDFVHTESPLKHGWSWAGEEGSRRPDLMARSDAYFYRVLSIDARDTKCALDYQIDEEHQRCDVLEYVMQPTSDSALYVEVALGRRNTVEVATGWLRIVRGSSPPTPKRDDSMKWTISVKPHKGPDSWQSYVVALPPIVKKVYGIDGWEFAGVKRIRLRGNMMIARITLHHRKRSTVSR